MRTFDFIPAASGSRPIFSSSSPVIQPAVPSSRAAAQPGVTRAASHPSS